MFKVSHDRHQKTDVQINDTWSEEERGNVEAERFSNIFFSMEDTDPFGAQIIA